MRHSTSLVLAATLLVNLACGSKVNRGTDGSTHFWITCTTDSECDGADQCICGHCTTECTGDAQCTRAASRCEVASSRLDCAVDDQICVPDEPPSVNGSDASVMSIDASVGTSTNTSIANADASVENADASVESSIESIETRDGLSTGPVNPAPTAAVSDTTSAGIVLEECLDTPGCAWTSLPDAPFGFAPATAAHNSKFYTFGANHATTVPDAGPGSGTAPPVEWSKGNFVYDLVAEQWSTLAPAPEDFWPTSAEVIGEKAYMLDNDGGMFIYDIVSDTWSNGAAAPEKLAFPTTRRASGVLYVFGGYDPLPEGSSDGSGTGPHNGPANLTTYVYTPESDTWHSLADAPSAAVTSTSCVLNDRLYVFVMPDSNGTVSEGSTLVYDMTTDTWTTDSFRLGTIYDQSCVALGEDLYLLGGRTPEGYPHTTVSRYRPATNSWDDVSTTPGMSLSPAQVIDGAIFVLSTHVNSGHREGPFWRFSPGL